MVKRRLWTAVIALAVAGVLLSVAYADLASGTKAPDFTLSTIDGKSFTLSNSFKNPQKVVVLDLWATWCGPCKAEVPYLVELSKDFKGKGVEVVGVALDQDVSTVKEFAKQYKINYTVPHDPKAQKVSESYKVRGIPTTYIIDKKGVIRYVHSGFPGDKAGQKKEMDKMRQEIRTLLAEK